MSHALSYQVSRAAGTPFAPVQDIAVSGRLRAAAIGYVKLNHDVLGPPVNGEILAQAHRQAIETGPQIRPIQMSIV